MLWLALAPWGAGQENLRHSWERQFYGRWERAPALLYNSSVFFAKLTFGDLDGDGDPDMLLGKLDGRIDRFRNDGRTGRPLWRLVEENITALRPAQGGQGEARRVVIDTGGHAAPVLVDIDRDGDMDLFVGTGDGRLLFFRNAGNPVLPAFAAIGESFISGGFGSNLAPYFVDVDRNRSPDLFVGNQRGEVFLMVNQGTPKRAAYCLRFPPRDALPDEEPPCRPIPRRISSIAPESNAVPALVDWDGDADLDLFVGKSDGTIAYYENQGTAFLPDWRLVQDRFLAIDDGGFAAPAFLEVNDDAMPDMLVGGSTNNVALYTSKDTGSVLDVWKVTGNVLNIRRLALGLRQVALSSGDLDGDGDRDLVVGDRSGRLLWLDNIGGPEAPAWSVRREDLLGGVVRENTAPWLADIDGDNDLDLLVGGRDGQIWLLRNTGGPRDAEFRLESTNFAGIDVGNDSVPAMVDIDGDGDLDLFVGNRRGLVIYYRNEGSATEPDFRLASTRFGDLTVALSAAPAFFDWNGDKRPDLVVGSRNGRLKLDVNDNDPEDPELKNWTLTGDPWGAFATAGNSAPHFADLNNDGQQDLLIGDMEGNVQLWWNRGASQPPKPGAPEQVAAVPGAAGAGAAVPGTIPQPQAALEGAPAVAGMLPQSITSQSGLVRLTGISTQEAVAPSPTEILLSEPQQLGPLPPVYTLASEAFGKLEFDGRVTPTFGDVDGDGDLDLVVGTGKGLLFYYRNDGSPEEATWTKVTERLADFQAGRNPSPLLYDLDGDQRLDLLVGIEDGQVLFYKGGEAGAEPVFTLVEEALAGINVGRNAAPAVALVDADPHTDLLVGNFTGHLFAFIRKGGAQSLNFKLIDRHYGGVDVGVASAPFVGDINRDEKPDLLIGSDQGRVSVFSRVPVDAKNAWGWAPVSDSLQNLKLPFGTSPRLADIDNDGDLDLLMGTEKGTIYFYRNDALNGEAATTQ